MSPARQTKRKTDALNRVTELRKELEGAAKRRDRAIVRAVTLGGATHLEASVAAGVSRVRVTQIVNAARADA